VRARDGSERILLWNFTRLVRAGDQAAGVLAIGHDITERKRAEEELRESEERFRAIAQSTHDAIISATSEGTIVFWNKGAQTTFGYAAEEVLGKPLIVLMPEHYRDAHQRGLERLRSGGEPKLIGKTFELYGLKKDGREFPLELSLAMWETEHGKSFSGILRDITERKRAEEELERRNRELAALNTITAAVSSSLELPEVLTTLKRLLTEEMEVVGGVIFLSSEADHRLYLQDGWGVPEATLAKWKTFPVTRSYTGSVAWGKEAAFHFDFHELGQLLAFGVPPEWQNPLWVLLPAKGEVQGLLGLFRRAPAAFRDHETAFLESLGQEVGVAIQNARLFEQVRASRQRLEALSRRLVEVQEAERRHIARELHDEIGTLSGLKLAVEAVVRLPAEKGQASLGEVPQMLNRLMARIRDLSLDLRPAMLDDQGLLPALLWYFERYTGQTRVHVTCEHVGLERRFPRDVETAAYRIVQEALTNVARHAGVSDVMVRLWTDQDTLGIQVKDSGSGFDPKAALAAGTSGGLSGMQQRACLLGGQLTVESAPGIGTCLIAEMPLGRSPEWSRIDGKDNDRPGR
jgi:PAS domain S-box-containing protein